MRSLFLAVAGLAFIAAAGFALIAAQPSHAGAPVAADVFKKECGACHTDFAPQFLPPASWRYIMENLANHFGENATLAPDVTKTITDYLVANADHPHNHPGAMPLRITDLHWFRQEHGGEEAGSMMRQRKVKTWADCKACHHTTANRRDKD